MLRIAHFVTHPIQYFAPLYRAISVIPDVELTVLFGSDFGIKPSYDPGLSRTVQFDVPLLDGFQHQFLRSIGDGKPGRNSRSFNCPDMFSVIKRDRFDVVWIHGWGYKAQRQVAAAARKAKLPYLVRGESTLLEAPKYSLRWWRRKLLNRSLIGGAVGCLYVGHNNRRFFESLGVLPERLFPAHYSVDVEAFQQQIRAGSSRESIRREMGVGDTTLVVATVAKLIARKRVADILQAAAGLDSSVHVWVLGDGEDREALSQQGQKLLGGRVRWFGFTNQSQIPAILNAADVFVLASNEETWGLVVNEAMACGLAAVVSDKVGCAADLIVEGKTGSTYPCGDVEALRHSIARSLADRSRLQQMGAAARELVTCGYSVQATATQICDAARQVVARI